MVEREDEHPAARYDREVNEVRGRAKLAIVALALTIAARFWDLGTFAWSINLVEQYRAGEANVGQIESADSLLNIGVYLTNTVLLLTAIAFIRWVRQLVKMARALGAQDMRWRPSHATWGFFIPILSLFRPYQVLRDVQQRLEPEELEPPSPRAERDGGDYRNVAMVVPPLAKRVPNSLLGLWWGSFVVMSALGRFANMDRMGTPSLDTVVALYETQIVVSVIAIGSAGLATRVVRSLTARLEERFRRIRHSTPESLARQQITLG